MMRQYDLIERVKSYNPNANEDLLNRAYVYAMKAHGTQTRASGDPYFSHPLEVAAILTDLKLDDATIVAALLHDTIEDTAATRAEIDEKFGPEIGALVDGLTKLKKLDLVTREAKQAENLRKLLLAIAADVRVLLIKLADRLHNMRTLDFMRPRRAGASPRRRSTSMRRSPGAWACTRCARNWRIWRSMNSIRTPTASSASGSRRLRARNKSVVTEIERQLTKKLADRGIVAEVKGRHKRPYSTWRKMERKSIGFEQLSDLVRIPRARGHGRGMLPGARHRPHHLADGADALQGLHLDPEAERLPLAAHHGGRARQAARRTADPHPRHARDRRIRHRGACALQGRARLALGNAVARDQRLCVAAAHHRAVGRGLQSGRVPRAHQARAVPRPGVLLHPEGSADRAAAQGDRDRFRLCGAHRCRQQRGRRQDQWPDRAARV